MPFLFIFITLGVTSFSFSSCIEERGNNLKIRMTSHPFNTYEQITLSYLLSVNQIMLTLIKVNVRSGLEL